MTWLRKALYGFVREPIEFETSQHEYIRIESRIQASLLGETEHIPKGVLEFVSASHWFQAGVRLYHARRRGPAYRVLRKAYQARDEFRAESRVELTRYFCLSAIRNHKYDEADACIKLLDGVYNNKGIAAFLKADLLHHQGAFRDAIEQYEISLDLNKGKNSRIERTYRPLIQCIILSPRPDFRLAEIYAKKWLELRHTVFSLMALPRVYLNWKYRADPRNSAPSDIDARLEAARATLENDPGVGSAAFELRAEEAELTGDYTSAIEYMDRAIGVDPRFELRAERWRFLARSRIPDLVMKAISELDAARVNQDYQSNWLAFLPGLAETYGIALLILGSSFNALNTFAPQLSTAEIASIITKVRKRRL
ncbi:hypothetical protein NUTIK01_05910 [Novosphingobium sp. IK01]|uniref:Tetratricopeptide repeat protein n=1 Tax=Novosphingobium pituita TaxID=3056842 RepID=A0ABQ6P3H9_9SPHN|nr:hypothetical protein NUTIK01_05910 [Novosphingobium sp. IK01]